MKFKNKLVNKLINIKFLLKLLSFFTIVLSPFFSQSLKAEEEKKGKTIIEEIWSYAFTDPNYSIGFCTNALKETERIKDTVMSAEFNRIIGTSYHNLSKYNLAIENYTKALNYYYKLNDERKIADVYNDISLTYICWAKYSDAIYYLKNALKIFKKLQLKKEISVVLSNIGSCYFNQFDYVNAVSHYLQAMRIADKIRDKGALAMHLNNLAIIYKKLKNFDNALVYYKKAMQIYNEFEDSVSVALIKNNMGNIYVQQGKTEQALKYFKESLETKKKIDNIAGIATTLNNIGEVYEKNNDLVKAIDYYQQSLKINEAISNFNGILYTTESMAALSYMQQDYRKAEFLFLRAVELSKIHNIPTRTSHHYLSEIYKIKNDYEKSLFHLQKVSQVQDSVLGSEKVQQINELLANYETAKRDEEITTLTETNKLQQRQLLERTVFSILLSILVILLVIFIILTIRNARKITKAKDDLDEVNRIQQETNAKLEDALEELRHEIGVRQKVEQELLKAQEKLAESLEKAKELNELKTRFISMISHEYRDPLAVIMNVTEMLPLFKMQKNHENHERYVQMIRNEVNRMVKLLNDVLVIGKKGSEQHHVNIMTMPVTVLCTDVLTNIKFMDEEKHNFILNTAPEVDLITTDTQYLSHVLSNLIINASKYSPWGTNINIDISAKDDLIKIKIRDEGIGIPDDDKELIYAPFHRGSNIGSISGNGLGLTIVKMYLDLLGGKIEFESQENFGTTFTVTMPKVYKS